jgi:hypothetical protein
MPNQMSRIVHIVLGALPLDNTGKYCSAHYYIAAHYYNDSSYGQDPPDGWLGFSEYFHCVLYSLWSAVIHLYPRTPVVRPPPPPK